MQPKREFDWQSILGNKAYRTDAIGRLMQGVKDKSGKDFHGERWAIRRHVRRAYYQGDLVRQRRGRFYYYCSKQAWDQYKQMKLGIQITVSIDSQVKGTSASAPRA